MMTTAGSLALEGSIAKRDSFVAQKLRAAGAVILGKTNLSEWRISDPLILRAVGAGVAARLEILCTGPEHQRLQFGLGRRRGCEFVRRRVGSETDGSIVSPSAMNSLVGIKPQLD